MTACSTAVTTPHLLRFHDTAPARYIWATQDQESGREGAAAPGYVPKRGLGTFLGVIVPCTSTLFGVVVFLRLSFVVGQAGVWCTLLIVIACFVLALLTTLSLCALISDGTDGLDADLIKLMGAWRKPRRVVPVEGGHGQINPTQRNAR